MNKKQFVDQIIHSNMPVKQVSKQFSPTNIALIKYWGKRNSELNLPKTSSLSITLGLGTHTQIALADCDTLTTPNADEAFHKRLFAFLDLFRAPDTFFHVSTTNQIPTGAGLASSASGFSALVLCLNDLYGWNLAKKELSMLARLASGSSSRSMYSGFVEWHAGIQDNGLDSYAEPLNDSWPELCMGIWLISENKKPISSTAAMNSTVATSKLYQAWPEQVSQDLCTLKEAIKTKDFSLFGQTCECNALSMHATMLAGKPGICYMLGETVTAMQQIWNLRKKGLEIYFTMDAGPNLKLLYLEKDAQTVQKELPFQKPVKLLHHYC